jgi:ABC-2 type transport system permease protein
MVSTLVKERFQEPSRLFADTLTTFTRCGILLALYWHVFKLNGGTINGTTFLLTSWSILFYFLLTLFSLRYIARKIMEDVQTGSVEVIFTKPISYLSYRMWSQVGFGIYSFLIVTVVTIPILMVIVGVPVTMTAPLFIPTALLTLILGCVLSLLLSTLVGLSAFWIEDANPVFWIIDKSVMILGGSYLPIALFPPLMYKLSIYSPFGAIYFITHSVYPSWRTEWPLLIAIQICWIIVMALVTYIVFQSVKKKVSVNGG